MKYYNDIARGKSVNLETVNAGWRGVGTKEFQSPIRVIGEKVTLIQPKEPSFQIYITKVYGESKLWRKDPGRLCSSNSANLVLITYAYK